jgi:hypothetical protein
MVVISAQRVSPAPAQSPRFARRFQAAADQRGEGAGMPRGHYLAEAVKECDLEPRAVGGSKAEIGRLGLPKGTVSKYLERVGEIRPQASCRPGRCLTLAEL